MGSRLGIKVGVKVGGSRWWGQGQGSRVGHDWWSGSRSGCQVWESKSGGQCQGEGVKVRGRVGQGLGGWGQMVGGIL